MMIEVKNLKSSKIVYAAIAVIFVAALVTLPYQNQLANAAPTTKKYQIYVTLTGVPANADNLVMNATLFGPNYLAGYQETTVSSPSTGDVVKFVFRVPSGGNENAFYLCGAQQANPNLSRCDLHDLPSSGGNGPIKVDFAYPQ